MLCQLSYKGVWAVKDSNLRRLCQLIYSQPPLATWVTAHSQSLLFRANAGPPQVADMLRKLKPTVGLEPTTARLQNVGSAD